MTSISPSERASLIKGLMALADFLETVANAPHSAEVMLLPAVRDGKEHSVICMDAEIATLASEKGSIAVPRNFGPVTYKITLSPRINTGSGER